MKVICPNCEVAFQMPESAVSPAGRWVKCGACAHVWQVYPGQQDDVEPAAEPPAPADDDAVPDGPAGFGAGSYGDADDDGDMDAVDDADDMPDDPFAALQSVSGEGDGGGDSDEGEDADTGLTAHAGFYDNQGEDDDDDLSLPPDDADIYGTAGLPALPARRSRLVVLGWIAYAVFMVILIGGLTLFRAPLVAAWPPLEGLYAPFVTPQPSAQEAFRVDIDPQPVWEQADDGWTMRVSGTVSNRSDLTLVLPPLDIELLDAQGATVRTEDAGIESRRLDPDQSAAFSVTIRNAPEQARGIDYRWETPGE